MKEYFLGVVLTALFGGICEELLPESSGIRPHLKLVTGLCVLLVLVLPMKDAITAIGSFAGRLDLGVLLENEESKESYEEIFEGTLSRFSEEELGRHLGTLIAKRFDLSEGDCRAVVRLDLEGKASSVLVLLSGEAILSDPYKIEAYVNELLSCPCDVAVE